MRFDVQRLTLFRVSTDFITFPGQTLKGDGNKFECEKNVTTRTTMVIHPNMT